MSRTKELVKNTMIITIGRVSTQFVTFLLLPLYTAFLSTEEFGVVDLITTIVQLCVPIISMMIDQGVFRYLLNSIEAENEKKAISSGFFTLTMFNLLFCFFYFILTLFVDIQFKFWILLIIVATAYSNLFLQIARGVRKTVDYSFGSFLCSVITIILNIVGIVGLSLGAVSMLIATFIGNICCSLFLFFKLRIRKYISFKSIDISLIKAELKYSVPLIPNQLSIWVMNSSDRVIVTMILGVGANGILAVSHKFVTIYLTLFNIFQLAWHETGVLHFYDEDRDVFFSNMMERILSIFATICGAMIVILPLVFNWFVDDAYFNAYKYIPIYLVASLFNVIIGILGVVYVATKKTHEIAKTTMISAAINIVVHLLLINSFGLFAASISTLVGYFITMIYRIVDTKKYINIKYNKESMIVLTVVLLFGILVYYMENTIISIVMVVVFFIVSYIRNKDMINEVFTTVKNKVGLNRHE